MLPPTPPFSSLPPSPPVDGVTRRRETVVTSSQIFWQTTMASEGVLDHVQAPISQHLLVFKMECDTAKETTWRHPPNSPKNGYTETIKNCHPKAQTTKPRPWGIVFLDPLKPSILSDDFRASSPLCSTRLLLWDNYLVALQGQFYTPPPPPPEYASTSLR